ncbi:hypothetical protein LguiB_019182 [Lonicera macranthoides]
MYTKTMNSELKCVWSPGPIIIGAGPSGLATAACLERNGVPFLILEKESCLASLWKLKTYDRLKLHLPKESCQLPYMPFPQEFPPYPTKQQFVNYLETYANRFSIEPMFGVEVWRANYDATMGFWRVCANDSQILCRWLIVATGENAVPALPEIDGLGDFKGRLLHSSGYKNGTEFNGRKVLVVGCGNSGMEVSLDLCNSGAQVSLVVRRKLHILPREVLGRSTFGLATRLMKWFPVRLVDWFLVLCSWLVFGDMSRLGLTRPEIGPLKLKNTIGKTPVLDVGSIAKIKSGEIKVVHGIQRFTSNGAEFVDGKIEEFESVILATGYRSNVASWLKEGYFSSQTEGNPINEFPSNWKGKNGLYSVGFTGKGLFGSSIDARKIADDITRQWKSDFSPNGLNY